MLCKLKPAYKDYLWGGTRLKNEYGKACGTPILAETWELSCHPDGESTIASGEDAGKTLAAYLAQHPESAGTRCAAQGGLPLMIKLIDAAKPLSIQVHPDEAYAQKNEGQHGKTEVWYVVEAQPGAFLYYGFAHAISKEEFAARIADNTLTEVLNKVFVKAGDVCFIEAGTVHAIGAGVVIAEIQQSSNVTYRVYDYGRVGTDGKPRALHVEKAKDVSVLEPPKQYDFGPHLAVCEAFESDLLNVDGTAQLSAGEDSFHSVLVLSGSGKICCGGQELAFQKGDSLFLSAGSGVYSICGNCRAIITKAGKKE